NKIKTTTCKSYTIKNLKNGKYYKYMVVAYKTVDGKQVVSSISKVAHVAVKGGKYGNATKITVNKIKPIKSGKKLTLKVTVKTDKKVKNHVPIRYESTNTKIAKVNTKGVITAKSKGECNIYVYAQNGVYKKVKVTVK
ncbi:MAG: Ig-like domain-containing protein, partial [Ruminococcus sp.]